MIAAQDKGSFSILVLAGLVCNAAAGLACALAGSLALAAAAFDSALCHITGIQGHDMFHDQILSIMHLYYCANRFFCFKNTCAPKSRLPALSCKRDYHLGLLYGLRA